MSHPLFNPRCQLSTLIHNEPPAKDHPNGFHHLGPASMLTPSGPSSATLADYIPGQNTPILVNNTGKLMDSVAVNTGEYQPKDLTYFSVSHRNDFPFSSGKSSTFQEPSAAISSASLDWLPSCASGFNKCQRVLSGGQVDNALSIPGLGLEENPVPKRSGLLVESHQAKHPTETVAEILQMFGLDEADLKELHSYPLDQITPRSLSGLFQQISDQKRKRAAATGRPSEPHPQPRSILKTSKVIDKSSDQIVDMLPLDEESTIKPSSDPSEHLQDKLRQKEGKPLESKDSKSCPLKEPESGPQQRSKTHTSRSQALAVHSSNSKPSKTQRKQKLDVKQRSKLQIRQEHKREKTDLQTQPMLGKPRKDEQVNKVQKGSKPHGSSSKASLSKLLEVERSVSESLPTFAMMEDYEGAPPRTFPHKCSLCDKMCPNIEHWRRHQSTRDHRENCTRLQRNKIAKRSSASSKSLRHRSQKSKPESRSSLNGSRRRPGLEGQKEKPCSGSCSSHPCHHHSRRSFSNSPSSRSVLDGRSRSPLNDPSTESHQVKYTPESAAEILQMFGLDEEDLKELDSYSEDQVTPDNLHLILRQIFRQKKRRATAAENTSGSKPNGREILNDNVNRPGGAEGNVHIMAQSLLKPRKVTDYGLSASCANVAEKIKTSTDHRESSGDVLGMESQSPGGLKKAALQKPVKHLKTTGLGKMCRSKIKLASDSKQRQNQTERQPLKFLGPKHTPLRQPQLGKISKIGKSSADLADGCPSASDLDGTKKKSHGKRAAAVVEKAKLQMERRPKTTKLKRKTLPKREASPCDVSFPVKGFISNHLPTLAMIKDYSAATPRTFPHTCTICNKKCFHMQDWLSHQNSSFHLESCTILRTQYPQWDGDVLPILSVEMNEAGTPLYHRHNDSRSPSDSPSFYASEGRRSRSRSSSRSYSPALSCCSKSRSRLRSTSHNDRGERSLSQSRSPYGCRTTQRSPSRSWSPRCEWPSSFLCYPQSRIHERLSSSRRRDEKWSTPRGNIERRFSPKRSHGKPSLSRQSQNRRLSTECTVSQDR